MNNEQELPPEVVDALSAYDSEYGIPPGCEGVTLGDWICSRGNLLDFVAYAPILWPKFMVHDDCVFDA